jgi:hypothetical protein
VSPSDHLLYLKDEFQHVGQACSHLKTQVLADYPLRPPALARDLLITLYRSLIFQALHGRVAGAGDEFWEHQQSMQTRILDEQDAYFRKASYGSGTFPA